jgi:HPt (histidine-containing phosphotransfer) domain-containing protein
MNDYISKPIDIETLKETILRNIAHNGGDVLRAAPIEPAGDTTLPILDTKRVLQTVAGSRRRLLLISSVFFSETPKVFDAIEEALSCQDFPALERQAHSYKGSCASLGAERTRDIAARLESAARDKQDAAARDLVPVLRKEFSGFRGAFEDWVPTSETR